MGSSAYGSVSQLIAQAKSGDEDALARLHTRYWPQLVGIAHRKLKGAPLRAVDEEDVAQRAFIGFYQSVKGGRTPRLENRHQLLALLTHIIACKATNEIKYELTDKRGGGAVQGATPLMLLAAGDGQTPAETAVLNDCYAFYVESLPDQLRPFAELHLAGLTNREIAEAVDCVERTVERKLSLLRNRWQQLAAESLDASVNQLLGDGVEP